MDKYRKRDKSKLFETLSSLSVLTSVFVFLETQDMKQALTIFLVCMSAVTAFILTIKHIKNKKVLNSGIDIIDKMTGDQFEEFLLQHFIKLGYKGYVTRGSQDYGADLVILKDNTCTLVQAKRWNNKVGIDAVQQITAALKHYNAQNGIVVTNSFFTANAVNLAKSNNISLWDRNKLISIMIEKKKQIEDNEQIRSDTSTNNICPLCGKDLTLRSGKRGQFWGCSGYPACKFTKNV